MTISRWEASPTSRDTAWFPTWFLQLPMEAWLSAPGKTWCHQCAATFTTWYLWPHRQTLTKGRVCHPETWPHACGSEPTNITATHASNRARLASPRQLWDSISRVLAADCSSAIACQITTVAHVCADMIGGDRCPHRWWPVAAATCSLTRSVGQTKPPGYLKKRNIGASFVKLTLLLRRAALRQWSSSYQQHAQTAMISFKLYARGASATTLSKNKVEQVKNESQVLDQTLAKIARVAIKDKRQWSVIGAQRLLHMISDICQTPKQK